MILAKAGDVFFTSSPSLLGTAIRWAERDRGEADTEVNHTGEVTRDGFLVPHSIDDPLAETVEALWHVERNLWYQRHCGEEVTVELWRCIGQTQEEIDREVAFLYSHVGDKYGWWKLAAHFLDNKILGGKRVARRLLTVDGRPICSYLVAKAKSLAQVTFAGRPEEQTPDGMHDYVKQSADWYIVGKEKLNG